MQASSLILAVRTLFYALPAGGKWEERARFMKSRAAGRYNAAAGFRKPHSHSVETATVPTIEPGAGAGQELRVLRP